MAAKRGKMRSKAEKPEAVVGAVRAGGKLEIDTDELDRFLKKLKKRKAKVEFVARNAPFMRGLPSASPIAPV
jgi:hypothetical protein